MSDYPRLYEFTKWLAEEYGTNGSAARASQIGEHYVKQDENKVYVFEWTGDDWEKVGIVSFDDKIEARSTYKQEFVNSKGEHGWDAVGFVEAHQR